MLRPLFSQPGQTYCAALAFLLGSAAAALADEVRLHDGRVLIGTVQKKGEQGEIWEVTTRDGVVTVAKSDVKEHFTDEQLRAKLAELVRHSEDTTFGNLQLAMHARGVGLLPEMWRHLDRALEPRALATASAPLQQRLRDFLGSLESEVLPRRWRGAATKVRVHQLLDGLHAATSPGRAAATEELLVREPNADQDLRFEARRNTAPRQRIAALQALQRRSLTGNDRFVLRSAILDGDQAVRTAAVDASRSTVRGDDVAYLATGLAHSNAKVRVRTAEALGGLGHPDAVKLLVLAAPSAGTGLAAGGGGEGVRGHIAILQQQSYIRDFDVEVAQAAMIADPKVDVLQSGTVLDVTVAGTMEVRTILRAYRSSLHRLTQNDPGEDPRRWPTWLEQMQPPSAPATTPKR